MFLTGVAPCENLKAFPVYLERVADPAKLPMDGMLPITRLGERHRFGCCSTWGSVDNYTNVAKKVANSAVFVKTWSRTSANYCKQKMVADSGQFTGECYLGKSGNVQALRVPLIWASMWYIIAWMRKVGLFL